MSKLKHTTSEFDSAIRKVRANYADVTNVNATASDVVEGKVFKSANKELVTGTLGNAEITPTIRIEGSVLGDQVSDYPIKATPSFKVKLMELLSQQQMVKMLLNTFELSKKLVLLKMSSKMLFQQLVDY